MGWEKSHMLANDKEKIIINVTYKVILMFKCDMGTTADAINVVI